MSGFIKKSFQPSTSCTQSGNLAQTSPIVSSGIPTLDRIMQLSYGSVNCIYEDESSFIHNTILQVFISRCITTRIPVKVHSPEAQQLFSFNIREMYDSAEEESVKNLLIAWRYQSIAIKDTKFAFNLMDKAPLQEAVICKDFEALLAAMENSKNSNFVVFSMFSPLFKHSRESKEWLLFEIRKLAKLNNHCVFLSVPKFFFKDQISQYFDNIVSIHSILNLPCETSIYNCIVEIEKLTTVGALRVNELESLKYGLIFKSKRITIERIDIPPEESAPTTTGCGSSFQPIHSHLA